MKAWLLPRTGVTMGPTPYDAEAEVRLEGDVVDELEGLLRAL